MVPERAPLTLENWYPPTGGLAYPYILQLDTQGQPQAWITWQDAVTYHAKGRVSWSLGEVRFSFRGGISKLTGELSVIKTASIIAVDCAVKRRYNGPTLSNNGLFRRDRCMCAYCGGVFQAARLSRDHVLPRSRGGMDAWTNVVTCCERCNQRKGDRTPEEAGMQLLYVPYAPSWAEHLILKNRNILADQMEFLLAFIPATSRIKHEDNHED